jgi:hypothetical protein
VEFGGIAIFLLDTTGNELLASVAQARPHTRQFQGREMSDGSMAFPLVDRDNGARSGLRAHTAQRRGESRLGSARLAPVSGADPVALSHLDYDFGTVLSNGQTVKHIFTVTNSTDIAVRLGHGVALRPCCSTIGPLPDGIPPHGKVEIPVSFKVGHSSGFQGVEFLIDRGERVPPLRFALRGWLLSAWDVVPLDGSSVSLPLGEPGNQFFRLIARRRGSEGLGFPEKVTVEPPLKVVLQDQVVETARKDGLVEATKGMELRLPPKRQLGLQRSEILFQWTDGRTESRLVSWEVTPRLKVTPTGLYLPASAGALLQTVAIVSDGRPFRVIGVRSSLLAEKVVIPQDSQRRHILTVPLDLTKADKNQVEDILIQTDHPDQSTVSISVLILQPDIPPQTGVTKP